MGEAVGLEKGAGVMRGEHDAFWLRYLRAHAAPETRALHYAGTSLGVAMLIAGVVRKDWRLAVAAPVLSLNNVVLTAHFAGSSRETRVKQVRNACDNVLRVARGESPSWIVPELRT